MAIENEVKYVLKGWQRLEAALALQARAPALEVAQGYLNPETRIRRASQLPTQAEHTFTFKRRLANGTNVEIETPIERGEFDLLWPACAPKLVKRRYKRAIDLVQWDIDFFVGEDGVYFALAEAEMPEGMLRPAKLPSPLQDHIAFEVPRADGRFNSVKLADEAYARALATELGIGA